MHLNTIPVILQMRNCECPWFRLEYVEDNVMMDEYEDDTV